MSLNKIHEAIRHIRFESIKSETSLFFPPEYGVDLESWKEKIALFKLTNMPIRLAMPIQQAISKMISDVRDYTDIVSVDEIVEQETDVLATISFKKNREGMSALYIYQIENLRLVPIIAGADPNGEISHFSLTYVPK